jgi:hypothetical protein
MLLYMFCTDPPHPVYPVLCPQALPSSMRCQLVLHLYRDLLDRVPFFQGKAPAFIDAVVSWTVDKGGRGHAVHCPAVSDTTR